MKKVLLFGLSIAALTFVSCSDDDGDNTSASIEGKWYYSKAGTIVDGQEILDAYQDNETGCEKDYIEFVEDGVFKDVDYYNADCDTDTYTTVWVKEGNTLTYGTGEYIDTETILSLTNNELKIKYTYNFNGGTYDDITVYTRN